MRGQLSGIDFLFAILAFSILFASYGLWMTQFSAVDGADQSALQLFDIRHLLLEGPGIPSNWNQSNAKVPGIAGERLVVNQTKLAGFLAMNYSQIQSLLGTGVHDFYFQLSWLNGSTIASTGLNGSTRPIIAQMRSLVVYNGSVAVATLRLSK